MAAEYDVIATFYDRAGMGNFASQMTQSMLNYAQQNEWVGRRVLDAGCGTGNGTAFFARSGFNVLSLDRSPAMLEKARHKLDAQSLSANLIEADIREMQVESKVDLVIAIDTLNELDSIRDLEAVFGKVHQALSPNRMFIFDLHTNEGLARSGFDADQFLYDADDMVVFARPRFDFERQVLVMAYDSFQQDVDTGWERLKAERVQRAFPVQAVATLLRRQKFDVLTVVDSSFDPYDLSSSRASRVIFFARNV